MENKKVNFKMLGYVMVHLDIKRDYELTGEQAKIYGFLYNHCINLKGSATESGWCGLSNENIAEAIGITDKTVSRSVKALKDKELIIIENEGKRTRQISISPKPFYCEETQKALDEAEMIKAENEQLKKQLKLMNERLLALQEEQPTISYLAKDLINTGYVSKEEYMQHWKDYNMLLEQFQQAVGFMDFNHRLKRVVRNCKNKDIYDKVAYLRGSLINNATDYHKEISMYEDIEI